MPTTPKNIKNGTDAPNGDARIVSDDYAVDAPNTADNDAGSIYSKISPYSLINRNNSPDAADVYADFPDDAAPPPSFAL